MSKTIMMVDDKFGTKIAIQEGLSDLGEDYELISTDSRKQCLELLENNKIPDLILLDVETPNISNLETFNMLKEKSSKKNIPMIFLTTDIEETAENIEILFSGNCIEKPFDIKDLKTRIDKALE